MKHAWHNVLIAPLVTEKSDNLANDQKQITFKVIPQAKKADVRVAVEKIFGVQVVRVNVSNVTPKKKRYKQRPGVQAKWKKAIVFLKDDQDINFASFE